MASWEERRRQRQTSGGSTERTHDTTYYSSEDPWERRRAQRAQMDAGSEEAIAERAARVDAARAASQERWDAYVQQHAGVMRAQQIYARKLEQQQLQNAHRQSQYRRQGVIDRSRQMAAERPEQMARWLRMDADAYERKANDEQSSTRYDRFGMDTGYLGEDAGEYAAQQSMAKEYQSRADAARAQSREVSAYGEQYRRQQQEAARAKQIAEDPAAWMRWAQQQSRAARQRWESRGTDGAYNGITDGIGGGGAQTAADNAAYDEYQRQLKEADDIYRQAYAALREQEAAGQVPTQSSGDAPNARYRTVNGQSGEPQPRIIGSRAEGNAGTAAITGQRAEAYMSDEQRQTYNYLYATQGKGAAEEYYKLIEPELEQARTQGTQQEFAELSERAPAAMTLLSTLASPTKIAAGVASVVDALAGDEINTDSAFYTPVHAISAIRQTVPQVTNWTGDKQIFGQDADSYIYGVITSSLDSALNMALATGLGSIAGGAAGLTEGATNSLIANATSALMGAEMLPDTVMEEKAKGRTDEEATAIAIIRSLIEGVTEKYSIEYFLGDPTTFGKKLGKAFLAEGGEEVASNWLNNIVDVVSGDPENVLQQWRDRVNSGENGALAFAEIVGGMLSEDAASFIAGGISGLGMGAVHEGIRRAGQDKQAYRLGALGQSDAQAVVDEALAINPDSKAAQRAKARLDAGKNVRSVQLGRIMEESDAAILPQEQALAEASKKYGKQAGAMQATYDGEQDVQRYDEAYHVAYEMGRAGANLKAAQTSMATEYLSQEQRQAAWEAGRDSAGAGNAADIANGRALLGGQIAAVQSISERDGKIYAEILQGAETKRVALQDLKMDAGTRMLAESAKQYGAAAPTIFEQYRKGQQLTQYLRSADMAVSVGMASPSASSKIVLDNLKSGQLGKVMSADQIEALYKAGQQAGKAQLRKTGMTRLGTGSFTLEDSAKGTKLDKRQRASLRFLRDLARVTGLDISVYKSASGADGTLMGANGSYVGGHIRVDLNAGAIYEGKLEDASMLRTVSHELTHFMAETAEAEFKELQSFLVEKLSAWEGHSIQDLVDEKLAVAKSHGRDISTEEALEEVVADGCEMMLRDSKAIRQLAEENRTLFEKVRDWMTRFFDALRKAFEGVEAVHQESVHMMENYAEELQKLWDDALTAAVKNAKESGQKNSAPAGADVRLSVQDGRLTAESTERERYELLKDVSIRLASVNEDAVKGVRLEDYNTRKKSAVIPGFRALAKQLGILNVDLQNSEIGFPFQFSGKNLEKSLHHQLEYGGTYQDYVRMMSCFNDLVENAVPIEVHTDKKAGTAREKADLKQVYVLVGAYTDAKNTVPVQFEVKEFVGNDAKLYLSVVLTKIDSEVLGTSEAAKTAVPISLLPESTISLRQLFENVNPADGRFLKYVPDGFLNEAQKDAKAQALRQQEQEYAGYGVKFSDRDSAGRELSAEQAEYFKDSKVRDKDGNLLVMYHGSPNAGFTVFEPYAKARYGLFGLGSYFTDNPDIARSYALKGRGTSPGIYEVYLNVTNPIDMDAQADPKAWKAAYPDADFPRSGTNEAFYRAIEEDLRDQMIPAWEGHEIMFDVIQIMGYDGITHIGGGRYKTSDGTRHRVYITFDSAQEKAISNISPTENRDIRYSERVTDKKTLDFLNRQKTVKTYKTMQLVDGKLYPPMAARTNGQYEDYSVLGQWEQATEHPELVRDGKYKLDKGKGQGSISAAYNPYMHSSNLVLNDQFSGAYARPNLVTVECEVPVSELTSGYRADGAKDAVGWHAWHTGTVAGQLRAKTGTERQVLLSRWIKPVRILSDAEVAQMYKRLLNGTDIAVPDNVVTPSLLRELRKAGVSIKESGRVTARSAQGESRVQYSDRDNRAQKSIKDQIRANAAALSEMKSVANIRADLRGMNIKEKRQWAENVLKASGYRVDRQAFGVIAFEPRHINEGLNYLSDDGEIAAFAALPQLLKRGKIINVHNNHKGRDFGTVTIAAPVEINGVRGNMAAVVKRTGKDHYHTHRILMPDGSAFEFLVQENTEPKPAGALSETDTHATPMDPVSENRIAQNDPTVKRQERDITITPAEILDEINLDAVKGTAAYDALRDYKNALTEREDIRQKLEEQRNLSQNGTGGEARKAKNRAGIYQTQFDRADTKVKQLRRNKALRQFVESEMAYVSGRQDAANQANAVQGRYTDRFEQRLEQGYQINRIVQDKYDAMVESYGAIPQGENASRTVSVPQRTEKGNRVSQTVRTAMEAQATTDEGVRALKKAVVDGNFSYLPITDKAAGSKALQTIKDKGYQKALADWTVSMSKGHPGKNDVALGFQLYNQALNSGDTKTAVQVLSDLASRVREGAQMVQAVRMLKKLSPDNQLYSVQLSLKALQDDVDGRYGKKAPKLKLNEALVNNFLEAENEAQKEAAQKAIYRDIASQLPHTFMDRWNSWRYLCMLGNARTHVRNILGNAGFVPVRRMKDAVALGIEAAYSKAKGGNVERSKGFVLPNSDLYKLAKADYETIADLITGGGKYNDAASGIESMKSAFGEKGVWKYLSKIADANSFALDAEDVWFSKPAYAQSLAGYLKANKITAEQFNADEAIRDKARAYAVKEAQRATYRDYNDFSNFIAKVGRTKRGGGTTAKVASTLMEGVLPFRRTPANILVRGVEYSPIGLAQGIYQATRGVKTGKYTAAQAIDRISSGLTGTALVALGALLTAHGILTPPDDDDEKQAGFDKLRGAQSYALKIGKTYVTVDWLAPEALPVFVGSQLSKLFSGDSEGGLKALYSALTTISEPMLEMSMLSSLQDVIENVSYADSKLMAILSTAATNYLTQAFPTLAGQIERIAESERETTFATEDSPLTKDLQYILAKIMNKTPGEFQQIPYIDAWGRHEDTGTVLARAFNNLLNPAYLSYDKSEPFEDELQRLYDLGYSDMLPQRVKQSQKVEGETLTQEEYVAFAETKGKTQYEALKGIIESSWYEELSDAARGELLSMAYSYADGMARLEVNKNADVSEWILETKAAVEDGGKLSEILRGRLDEDVIDFKTAYPQYADLSDNKIHGYLEFCEPAGVPLDTVYNAAQTCKDFEGEKDSDGKTISGSVKAQVVEYIQSLGLNRTQAKALWDALKGDWKDKDTPWA